MDKTAQDEYKFSSVLDLHKSEDASVLIASHQSVVEFHVPNMENRELCHNFLAGDPWTIEEREVARQKKKPLTEFNPLKSSERTFIGSMIQQRYDIKPAPREPTDQDKADIFTAMYHWTADITGTRYKDPNLVRGAWAGGSAWQESFVEVTPGKKPRIHVTNQNNFAIYPDPNRRDLIEGSDCEFIDRVSWMSRAQLADAIPDKEDEILAGLPDPTNTTYDQTKVHADRTHEYSNYRNGKYKVIERFYKVRKKLWKALTPEGETLEIGADVDRDTRQNYQENYPDHTVHMERQEFLYLAIVCPSMGNEFLYNDVYHCQPRDPVTTRIMFPLVELVDEELDGQTSGHVFPQISGIKLTNSLLTNKLFAAKNAASQSHVGSADHFDEPTRQDIEQNHNDGSRTFWKKPNAPEGSGMMLIEQGRSAPDNDYLLNYAASYTEDVSSTPPTAKGMTEGSASGVLNEQRIAQAGVQSLGFNNNYSSFLVKRAKLWKYYWKEYWKAEEVIRVLEKKDDKDPDWITINQIVADEYGNVQTKNSLDDADAYDITFEDSFKSPTVRDKVQKQLSNMMQNGSLQQDPELSAAVYSYFLMLSDAPQEFKNEVKQIAENKKKAKEAAQAAGPVPEPVRLSASIKSEDLHDQNMILFLENAKAIPPELAQQMLQAGPAMSLTSEGAGKQADPAEAQAKQTELQLKAAELRMKAQEITEGLQLKAQELELKRADQEHRQALAEMQANQPTHDPAHDMMKHEMSCQTDIEKEHIKAEAGLYQTRMAKEKPEGEDGEIKKITAMLSQNAKETQQVINKKLDEIRAENAREIKAIKETQNIVSALEKAINTPKVFERDGSGKITGVASKIDGTGRG